MRFALAALLALLRPGAASAIINGRPADGSEPFAKGVAGIGRKTEDGFHIFCTASLLKPGVVVTAAHCLHNRDGDLYVVFGLSEKPPAAQGRKVTRVALHERWVPAHRNDDKDRADIALAAFEGGVPSGYEPLPLLPDEGLLRDGARVVLAGYGVTDETGAGSGRLRYTMVPLLHADYAETEAETDESRSGSCAVDSGGPALVEAGGRFYLWGATSHGGGAGCTGSGVYTKLTSYRAWMDGRLRSWEFERLGGGLGAAVGRAAAALGAR